METAKEKGKRFTRTDIGNYARDVLSIFDMNEISSWQDFHKVVGESFRGRYGFTDTRYSSPQNQDTRYFLEHVIGNRVPLTIVRNEGKEKAFISLTCVDEISDYEISDHPGSGGNYTQHKIFGGDVGDLTLELRSLANLSQPKPL